MLKRGAVTRDAWTRERAAMWGYVFAQIARDVVLPLHMYARYAVAQRPELLEVQREQVRQMMDLLEGIFRLFNRPGPLMFDNIGEYQHAVEQIHVISCDLAQWDDNREALEIWEKLVGIAAEDKIFFRQLVTVPLLEGKANWTAADSPIAYLRRSLKNERIDEEKEGRKRRQKEVPLEDAPEPEAPVTGPADDPMEELIAAALRGSDAEVNDYGKLVLRGATHEEARRQLGWYKVRAHRVEVRYRRHLKRAAKNRDLQTCRQALAALHGASHTVRRVTFADDTAGRQRSYFEHKKHDET